MARIDIMVDIETLGKGNYPPVFQISAVAFNLTNSKVYDLFNEVADISTMDNIEADTLKWWLKTNPMLLSELVSQGSSTALSEESLIKDFLNWIEGLKTNRDIIPYGTEIAIDEIYLWGNGILFDNRILKAKCDEHNLCYPIFYRNDRDMRTIIELAAFKCGMSAKDFIQSKPFEGTQHNAIDDAINQVKLVCKAYNILMEA